MRDRIKFYPHARLKELNKEMNITIMGKCIYRNKTQLFAQKDLINFKSEPITSLKFAKEIVRRCYERCGDNKCSAYYNFMQDIAEDYKNAQEENNHGRK